MFEKGGFFVSLSIKKYFSNEDNIWNLEVVGEIDIYTSPDLRETLKEILDEKLVDIKIDCSKLDYIDSTGLGVLIGILKKLRNENKNIIIVNPKENISKLLKITGLDKIFVIK